MKRSVAAVALVLCAALPVVAGATTYDLRSGRFELAQAQGQRPERLAPLPRILAMLREHYGGRHLDADQGQVGDRPAYFVQWQLPDGKVVVFVVDAQTGQVIGRQGG